MHKITSLFYFPKKWGAKQKRLRNSQPFELFIQKAPDPPPPPPTPPPPVAETVLLADVLVLEVAAKKTPVNSTGL